MASTALVSVALLAYNGEQRLEETLDSLLAQEHENLVVNVLDNASTDRTPGLIDAFARRDSRVTHHRHARTISGVETANRGLALSSGKYFMWAGQDDVLDPRMISECVRVLEATPDAVLAYPRAEFIDADGRPFEFVDGDKIAAPDGRLVVLRSDDVDTRGLPVRDRCVALLTKISSFHMIYGLARRETMLRVRGFRHVWTCELPLLTAASLEGAFAHVPEPLMRRRIPHKESPGEYEWKRRTLSAIGVRDADEAARESVPERNRRTRDVTVAAVLQARQPLAVRLSVVRAVLRCFEARFEVRMPLYGLRDHVPARTFLALPPLLARRRWREATPDGAGA
jgi:Glycosyl transferase family 2